MAPSLSGSVVQAIALALPDQEASATYMHMQIKFAELKTVIAS